MVMILPEERQLFDLYENLFNAQCPMGHVGMARIQEAINARTPVPYSEYEKRERGEEERPTHCSGRSLEEEQAIKDYEHIFGEKCPFPWVECERIKLAISENTPIPKTEYMWQRDNGEWVPVPI